MLKDYPVHATIPVTDLDRAKAFYEQKLGLIPGDTTPEGQVYAAGQNTLLYIYKRGPSKADHTLAGFTVDNIEQAVDELTGKGVAFEQYNIPGGLVTNEKGIATMGESKAAWFKDPDGNILGVVQMKT